MLVRAIEKGYGGLPGQHAIREPGDVFEVEDGAKATWFQPAEPPRKEGGKPNHGKQTGDTLVG